MARPGSSSSSSSSLPPKRQRDAEAPPPPVAGKDMLMFLPPEILDIILARIPFEKLVRTCCLSREGRRRWESVPFLDIRLPRVSATVPDARALWRCAAPIHGFRAYVRTSHFYRAASWLRALARKRVQNLTLELEDHDDSIFSLPPAYALLGPALFSFSGAALVRLHLHHCHMPPAPRGFPGFPNLVSLALDHVSLPFVGGGEQLEHLIAAAPRLAELSLDIVVAQPIKEDGGFDRVCEWAIHAPNLRVLKMVMWDDGRIAEDLPLLEEADISIDWLLDTPYFLDTLRRIVTVNKLWFDTNTRLWETNPLEGISWKFDNLREARLSADFGRIESILSIFSSLRCAPHIENFNIVAYDFRRQENEIDEDFLNSEMSYNLLAGLKYMSCTGTEYSSNLMCFMKFVLSRTESLQSFVVTTEYHEANELYGKVCTELVACRKASPYVKVRTELATW